MQLPVNITVYTLIKYMYQLRMVVLQSTNNIIDQAELADHYRSENSFDLCLCTLYMYSS